MILSLIALVYFVWGNRPLATSGHFGAREGMLPTRPMAFIPSSKVKSGVV